MTEPQFLAMIVITFFFFFASAITEVLLGLSKNADKEEDEIVVRVSGNIIIAPEGVRVIRDYDPATGFLDTSDLDPIAREKFSGPSKEGK